MTFGKGRQDSSAPTPPPLLRSFLGVMASSGTQLSTTAVYTTAALPSLEVFLHTACCSCSGWSSAAALPDSWLAEANTTAPLLLLLASLHFPPAAPPSSSASSASTTTLSSAGEFLKLYFVFFVCGFKMIDLFYEFSLKEVFSFFFTALYCKIFCSEV